MSFGGQDNTTTSKVELSNEQKALLGKAMPYANQYAANPIKLPNTPMTAGFDPAQLAGQQMALNAAGSQGQIAGDSADASRFLLTKALYPDTNPALKQAIDAAARPINESLTEKQLPAVRGEAALRGQYGGSRQGIAEGIAMKGASQAIGDASAKVANEGYANGLDAMYRTLGLAPQTSDLQLSPGITTSGVGEVRQGQNQAMLDEGTYRNTYNQRLPLMTAEDLLGLVSGIPSGGSSVTAPGSKSSPLSGALGGASLGSALFPAMASAGPIGAGLGALLSFL
jgi:hypothetical protein